MQALSSEQQSPAIGTASSPFREKTQSPGDEQEEQRLGLEYRKRQAVEGAAGQLLPVRFRAGSDITFPKQTLHSMAQAHSLWD